VWRVFGGRFGSIASWCAGRRAAWCRVPDRDPGQPASGPVV